MLNFQEQAEKNVYPHWYSATSGSSRHCRIFSSTLPAGLVTNNIGCYEEDNGDLDDGLSSDESYDQNELVLEVDGRVPILMDGDPSWSTLSIEAPPPTNNDLKSFSSSGLLAIQMQSPPPKPTRTFEHDLYTSGMYSTLPVMHFLLNLFPLKYFNWFAYLANVI